jgi:acyl carrier protein
MNYFKLRLFLLLLAMPIVAVGCRTAPIYNVYEIPVIIARAVNLERPVEDIDPNAPLFHEGWGLDSIDMLEIALTITKRYGFQLRSDDVENTKLYLHRCAP